MTTIKYPSYLYKIDGFEKMANEAAVAHGKVKKAFKIKSPFKSFFASSSRKMPFTAKEYIKDIKLQEVLRGDPEKMKSLLDGYKAMSKGIPSGSFAENLMESVHNMPPTAILATALVGAAPAAILAEKVIGNRMEKGKVDRSYRDMMSIYPDLRREKQEDVKRYFDYVGMYSPTVAKNPHAAGSIIKRMISSGGVLMDHSIIEGLLKVEKMKAEGFSRSGKGDRGTGQTIGNIASHLGSMAI